MQQAFEELLYQYKVDLYVDGHVHGYERSYPVYQSEVRGNYTLNNYVNPEAPIYIVNGSAGVRISSPLPKYNNINSRWVVEY